MLIETIEELRLYIPNHVMDTLTSVKGFLENSEHDFLLEKLGLPLYKKLCAEYEALTDKSVLLPGNDTKQTPWMVLIGLCQRAIVFDAFYRAADFGRVSVNESGINVVVSDHYDSASDKSIEMYKTRCNTEAHRAIDRVLNQLEEWARENEETNGNDTSSENTDKGTTDLSENGNTEKSADADGTHSSENTATTAAHSDTNKTSSAENEDVEKSELATKEDSLSSATLSSAEIAKEIVALWQLSKYYYKVDGLFINTGMAFNDFVDIYDSREKFVTLLPDLRYCQDIKIMPELGLTLCRDLLDKYRNGKLNASEKDAVYLLQRTLAIAVEARNKMFKRPEAADEALMSIRIAVSYIVEHYKDFNESALKVAPFYASILEKKKSDTDQSSPTTNSPLIGPYGEEVNDGKWRNNRRGNSIFVTHPIV